MARPEALIFIKMVSKNKCICCVANNDNEAGEDATDKNDAQAEGVSQTSEENRQFDISLPAQHLVLA